MILAKLHTMSIVNSINKEFPSGSHRHVPLYQHVDDMTNLFIMPSQAYATELIVEYAEKMSQLF